MSDGPRSPSCRPRCWPEIQTPKIGRHEERALRLGLSYRPDLIVLTGDYVQDALGEAMELDAAAVRSPCGPTEIGILDLQLAQRGSLAVER